MAWLRRPVTMDDMVARAQQMRYHPTAAELRCRELLAERFGRASFKNQRIVGRYIVDFMFPDERVIIEVDGRHHRKLGSRFYDSERDDYLRRRGYFVLRVDNDDVLHSGHEFVERVARLLRARGRWWARWRSGFERF